MEAQRSHGAWARMHSEIGPSKNWNPVQFSLLCYPLPQRLSHALVPGKGLLLMNYLIWNKPSRYLGLQRQVKGHM